MTPTDKTLVRHRAFDDDDQTPERVIGVVELGGVAPDPYEDDPQARALALAPLLAGESAFALSRFGSDWSARTGTEKLDFLLGLPDPEATVQALACEEFAFLANDIGMADSAALLTLASPAQLQAVIDLDAWRGDTFEPRRFGHWLSVAAQAGTDTVDRLVASQPAGIATAVLTSVLTVYETAEEAEELGLPDHEQFLSPDSAFMLAADSDDPQLPTVRALLDSLYRIDIVHARKALRACRWELPSALESDLLDDRAKRIANHGFMGQTEARRIYEFVDPQVIREQMHALLATDAAPQPAKVRRYHGGDVPRTGLAMRNWPRGAFLSRAVERCSPEDQGRLEIAFTRLAYRIHAARAAGAADIDELPRWTRHALSTCDIGLEFLSDGDQQLAVTALTHLPVIDLFRAGHGLVVRLHHAARRLRRDLGGNDGVALIDGDGPQHLRGLLGALPERWSAGMSGQLDDETDEPQDVTQPFESIEQVHAAGRELASIRAAAGLVQRITGQPPAAVVAAIQSQLPGGVAHDVRLSSLVGTAIARTVLGGAPGCEPLLAAELQRLLAIMFDGPSNRRRVRDDVRAALSRSLLSSPHLSDAEVEALSELVATVIARFDDELGGLSASERPDPEFVGTALLVSGE